ncbi:50S ribosomal protein L9 [Salinisphaera sp. P385]|uniref:Large ribosomal subunit protein bL9 n=1 Tax=Spectribacter acetivorans TaxID=3075603 RepID=A0ABU3B7H0_9GAMM|nr:50S ribosomal protein L9 [Salinisphaera sp. P385]MDT0617777.1 50S ribosomal protein L9 [Salinisphaera sp. P385]
MQVILLQKVRNLGDIGDEVKVRAGYGRNFLIPRGVALMATVANRKTFESRKDELLKASEDRMARAQGRAESFRGKSFTVPMRASDEGKLYGSVGPQEIVDVVTAETGAELDASEVILAEGAIRQTGYFEATLQLHAEVEVQVELVVAQLTDMGVNMPNMPVAEDETTSAAAQLPSDEDEDDDEYAEEAEGAADDVAAGEGEDEDKASTDTA